MESGPLILRYPGSRVRLVSPPSADDDAATLQLHTEPLTTKYLPVKFPEDMSVGRIANRREKRLKDKNKLDFNIHLRQSVAHTIQQSTRPPSSSTLVGACELTINSLQSSVNVGIMIVPSLHRMGFASEALFLLMDYAFKNGLHRLEIDTCELNLPMRGWCESFLGLPVETRKRQACKNVNVGEPGTWSDMLGYAVLKDEWEQAGGKREALQEKLRTMEERRNGYTGVPTAPSPDPRTNPCPSTD
jgi:RimJ/RimL family protein N-acetyltransferase